MTVRRATAADVANIHAAERAYIDCPWTAEQISSEIGDPTAVFLVAEDGGFLGYISGKITLDECEIGNIAVEAGARRRGVGSTLMIAFLKQCEERGVTRTVLQVRSDNAAALRLYEKCGFTVVGERKGYYQGKNAYIMVR